MIEPRADELLAQFRKEGWMVAVHNDYRTAGEFATFWLLTRGGRLGEFFKGEGDSDLAALLQIRQQMDAGRKGCTD